MTGRLVRKQNLNVGAWAVLILLFGSAFISTDVLAQGAGSGPQPIPRFIKTSTTYAAASATYVFSPADSYLPAPTVQGQVFQYTANWNFGNGQTVVVGPTTAQQALIPATATYSVEGLFTVTLRIDVLTSVNGTPTVVASGINTDQVRFALPNYAPTPVLQMLTSPATGTLPYTLAVSVSSSVDQDGYIIWAEINWGDGTSELVNPLPPVPSSTLLTHTYNVGGPYTVTLSVIDNGRAPSSLTLPAVPPAGDPRAALTAIQAQHTAWLGNGSINAAYNTPSSAPILRQDFLQVFVPGNIIADKGNFKVKFTEANSDAIDVTFDVNQVIGGLANASVSITIGSGATALVIPTFTTDAAGNFRNQAQGFIFQFNGKRQTLRLKMTRGALQTALNLSNATVINGSVDLPVTIDVVGSAVLSATVHFGYNSKFGKTAAGRQP